MWDEAALQENKLVDMGSVPPFLYLEVDWNT